MPLVSRIFMQVMIHHLLVSFFLHEQWNLHDCTLRYKGINSSLKIDRKLSNTLYRVIHSAFLMLTGSSHLNIIQSTSELFTSFTFWLLLHWFNYCRFIMHMPWLRPLELMLQYLSYRYLSYSAHICFHFEYSQ